MKKIITWLAALSISASAFAGGIGFVDVQYVISKYAETQKTMNFLESKKIELQKELDADKAKIEEAEAKAQKEGATDKDKEAANLMKEQFTAKIQNMQTSLDTMQNTMLEKLKSDIRVAIKEVGKIKKYDAVLEKQVVYYGGTDISEDVVKFLSGVEKIELKK